MLAVLSPAKKLNFDPVSLPLNATEPVLKKDTAELLQTTRTLKASDLQKLMKLSPSLAKLNFERFQSFVDAPKPKDAKVAALAFNGDTYAGLKAWEFDAGDLKFAQAHLRILSGLYGVLRPLDLIQPYRLEMGTRLATHRGKNLYEFWGERIASKLSQQAKSSPHPVIVNLASTEYFSAVAPRALSVPVITCVFKEIRNGKAQVIGFSAKRARGMMAHHIVRERLDEPEGMKAFTDGGYRYDAKSSTETDWVFSRES